MSNETDQPNLPTVIVDDDGFNDDQANSDLIKGGILRCVDGLWSCRDETPLPETLIVLACSEALQRWEKSLPVETVVKRGGQPLPDVDTLNARIPKKKWETGLDGNPRPPWQHQYVAYLLDPRDAAVLTYLNSTAGAKIAVRELKDKVAMMRKLRGEHVVPVVELSAKSMKTQFGTKQRPHFNIVDWRNLGAPTPAPAIEHKASVGEPVKTVTTEEFLNDEIPDFDDA